MNASVAKSTTYFQALISGEASPAIYKILLAIIAVSVGSLAGVASQLLDSPLYIVVALIGLIATIVTIQHKQWGLLVMVFLAYTRFSDVLVHEHGLPSIAQPFMLLLLGLVLVRWFLFDESPPNIAIPSLLMIVYGLVLFSALLYAKNPDESLDGLTDYVKDVVIAIVVILLLTRGRTLRGVIWTLLIAGIFMGTISVYQQLTGPFDNIYWGFGEASQQHIVGEQNEYRIAGPIGDPNFYSQIMLVLLPLALDRLWQEKRPFLRLLAAWALGVSFLTIIFTFSRGAFLAVIVMGLVLLTHRRPNPVAILLVIVLALPLLQFVPPEYMERIETMTALLPTGSNNYEAQSEVSFRGRMSETTVGWMMFRDHPLIGVGYDNFPEHYLEYSSKLGLDNRLEARSAHSLYLQLAAETGMIGLLVFGTMIAVIFIGLLQAEKKFAKMGEHGYAEMTNAFMIGLIGYLIAAIFLHAAYPRYMWLLFGIAFAIPNVASNELRIKQENA